MPCKRMVDDQHFGGGNLKTNGRPVSYENRRHNSIWRFDDPAAEADGQL